ncbi:MtaA/CmuA family methyltransferase [bacterium]|nr:MtaA/CmuA family methyltransferase [bacterium]
MLTPGEIFMKALHRQPTPRPATGSATSVVTVDLMKKTGIFFPEAHLDAELMAGLAAAGHTVIGFDNVMPLFSVWHESAALGCTVDWGEMGRMPDSRDHLYKIDDEIRVPGDFLNKKECRVPLDAIEILKRRFGNEVAVVGKVFGPWTLGYHVFGVEEFLINTILKPDSVKRAMESLKQVTLAFGTAQVEAGADALCYADHATRDLCSPDAYRDFLLELHQEMSEKLPCPLILHICGDTSDRIKYIRQTGMECFHFDSKVPAQTARELAGDSLSLMGGTSNFTVIREGTPEIVARDVEEKFGCGIDIIGPECAVPLDAPCMNLKILADEVKKLHNPGFGG